MIEIKVERFNVPAAANFLGLSRDTVIRLCDTHQIKHERHQSGKYVKRIIHADDLEAYRKAHCIEAEPITERRPGRPPIYDVSQKG